MIGPFFKKLAVAVEKKDWSSFTVLIENLEKLSGFCGAAHVYYDCIYILMNNKYPLAMLRRYQRLVEDVLCL